MAYGGAGETFKGAAGGAGLGAAVGSVVPGVGTAIGAGIGALGGGLLSFFGGGSDDEQKRQLEEYRKSVMNRSAPQIAAPSTAVTSDFRSNQQNLINRLEALASGQGPSLAEAQLKQATDRNMAQQQSIAATGRGNPTLANIVAANNSSNFGQGAAQQAAMARITEQQMALQQLGGVTQGARGMDEATSQFNAQQQNFANQSNLEAKLRTMGLNDSAILSIMQQISQVNARPTMGDQLLAGGVGALGMYGGQAAAAKAAKGAASSGANMGAAPAGFTLDQFFRNNGI